MRPVFSNVFVLFEISRINKMGQVSITISKFMNSEIVSDTSLVP